MRKILLTLIVLLTGLHIFANDEKQYELTALYNIAYKVYDSDVSKVLKFIEDAKKIVLVVIYKNQKRN